MSFAIKRLVKATIEKVRDPRGRMSSGFHSDRLDPFLSLLKSLDFAPHHILDIGANRGDWTRTALRYFPDAHYTLVEPQEHLRAYIRDLEARHQIEWIHVGAADQAGSLPFTIAARDDSSTFLLTKEQAEAEGARQILVEVRTLNQIAGCSSAGMPELVKIDAEGLDLRVLRGASDLLGQTDVFLVEAAVCAPLENRVSKVLEFMHAAGYSLMDVTDLNRSPKHGVLWLCELAFVRAHSRLLNSVRSYE